mmetsp:Transcript_96452/g.256279  ORF Transcript_96452/g.256279 Transcript_96452/m.256279 type:complete len:224 (+) Transcript_96452:434-1105(+)
MRQALRVHREPHGRVEGVVVRGEAAQAHPAAGLRRGGGAALLPDRALVESIVPREAHLRHPGACVEGPGRQLHHLPHSDGPGAVRRLLKEHTHRLRAVHRRGPHEHALALRAGDGHAGQLGRDLPRPGAGPEGDQDGGRGLQGGPLGAPPELPPLQVLHADAREDVRQPGGVQLDPQGLPPVLDEHARHLLSGARAPERHQAHDRAAQGLQSERPQVLHDRHG